MKSIGHPEQKLAVVHIGGTNGKGSTAAFLEGVAMAAGLSVGKYTSPHLSSYTERMTINRQPISLEILDALVEEVRPVIDRVSVDPKYGPLTEFEVSTILAFLYFAQSKVDLALIEVGMGGRLDATNVVRPVAVGLTHIDLDHQDVLGSQLLDITREKAGIIKMGVPVVSARQYPEALKVLRDTAQTVDAPLVTVGDDILATFAECSAEGTWVWLGCKGESPRKFRLSLLGSHQAENAAVAFGLLQVLKEKGFGDFSDEIIAKGFSATIWPGRFELISEHPKTLFDGGHNPDGFRALSNGLDMIFPGLPKVAVIGILNNRPVEEMVKIIGRHFHRVIATRVDSQNAADPKRLTDAFHAIGVPAETMPDPGDAFQWGKELAINEDCLLVVAGSLYLIGQLRPLAFEQSNM